MECSHCMHELVDGAVNCPECGGSLIDESTSSALVPQSASREMDDREAHRVLTESNLLRIRGRYTEAVECCTLVMKAQPDNLTAHSLMGDICRDEGRLEDAAQWYRMAIDLKANPSDEARLADIVRRLQRYNGGDSIPGGVGTSSLMGYSPRRWLNVITLVTVLFLFGIVVALSRMHNHKPSPIYLPAAMPYPAASTTPAVVSNPYPQPLSLKSSSSTGSGIPPDKSGGIGSQAQAASTASTPANSVTASELPAPNRQVSSSPTAAIPPLPAAVLPGPAAIQQTNPWQTSVMTGGFELQSVTNVGGGMAAVQVLAPASFLKLGQDAARGILIQNMFRAARNAFASSTAYSEATIFVEVIMPAGEESIAQGSISRGDARSADPDTNSLTSLQAAISNFTWNQTDTAPASSSQK